jgi:polysaccharide biosynthesis protein PslH
MRILFIVPYVPNLVRVRPYNLIKTLSKRGHKIILATLWTSPDEQKDIEAIRPFCEEVVALFLSHKRAYINTLAAFPTHEPLQASYCWHPGLAVLLIKLITDHSAYAPVDLVHIEHLRGVRYGLYLQESMHQEAIKCPPIIWDSVDNISYLFKQASSHSRKLLSRFITHFELARTERYESWLLNRFQRILVTSPKDRQAFIDLNPVNRPVPEIVVIPNGVDLDYFSPDTSVIREPDSLVISGKMSYHANVTMVMDFVNFTLPRILEKRPLVKLWLVGKDPTPELQALVKNPAIEVTGTVADIRPYLRKAALAVAPLTYGTGIQNKVLEAMACATPVVTTPQAISALGVTPGVDVQVGRNPQELSQQILELLGNPHQRETLGWNGRSYVECNHRWDNIVSHLEEVYNGGLSY